MTTLDDLRPRRKRTVMDCVAEAGVDVSDWANYKGGVARANRNPKYCYEWGFHQPGKVAVLNLWHDMMREHDGRILHERHLREMAGVSRDPVRDALWKTRAKRFEELIATAWKEYLPVRVILCDGDRRQFDDPDTEGSRVKKRELDGEVWRVTAYDPATGFSRIERGAPARRRRYADQFDLPPESPAEIRKRTVNDRRRSAEQRSRVLDRAKGKCEFCKAEGFLRADGTIFLETHHIIPLADRGDDKPHNMAALCPTHHREAHHGARAAEIRAELLRRFGKPDRGRDNG